MSKTFNPRIYYKLIIKLESPLSVGSGEDESTDHDVIINGEGKPFIPASAICGVMRHSFDRNKADKIFGKIEDPKISEDEKAYRKDEDHNNGTIESSVIFYDANLKDGSTSLIVTRDSVKLENKVGVKGAKFDMEAVEPGVEFVSFIELLNTEYEEEINNTLAAINAGVLRFGSKTTRGYGRVSLTVYRKTVNSFDEYLANNIFDNIYSIDNIITPSWSSDEILVLRLSLKNRGAISIREYSTDVGMPDYHTISLHSKKEKTVPVIPGTSWAGAFRERYSQIITDTDKVNSLFGWVNPKEKDDVIKSKIVFNESQLTGGTDKQITRNSIDRFSAATKDGALYTERTYYNGETELVITISRKLDNDEKFALAACIADLHNGFLAIGGLTSVGRGIFEVTAINGDTEKVKYLAGKTLDLKEVF